MNSSNQIEHFVTLFDNAFLPMGMTLHGSLMRHGQPFHLWIICMDEPVEKQLELISLPYVTLLPLREIETRELLEVKPGRSLAEYCWTLTPFSFSAVLARDANIERVTYLDADLFFFSAPDILLRELDEAGKHVLITEHAYAPEYAKCLKNNGRFCVQFMTFRRTAAADRVLRWWQEKCLEWCFARIENGKYGDQMYLDSWPEIFADEVHIFKQTDKTLAPWNVRYFEHISGGALAPVFYHFHSFRIVEPDRLKLYQGYSIGKAGLALYETYASAVADAVNTMNKYGIPLKTMGDSISLIRRLKLLLYRQLRYTKLKLLPSSKIVSYAKRF